MDKALNLKVAQSSKAGGVSQVIETVLGSNFKQFFEDTSMGSPINFIKCHG